MRSRAAGGPRGTFPKPEKCRHFRGAHLGFGPTRSAFASSVKTRFAYSGPKIFLQKRQYTFQRTREKIPAARKREVMRPESYPTLAPAHDITSSVEDGFGYPEQLHFSSSAALLMYIVLPSRERANTLELRVQRMLQGRVRSRTDAALVAPCYQRRNTRHITI